MLQYVSTKYGQLEGTVSPRGYTLFKGVPYAAPPVGKMRWKPSVDPAPWDGIRACDQWGNACLQAVTMDDPTAGYGKEFYDTGDYPPRMDEDCLYLNIWTPAQDPGEKLPVMMWIHGGGVQTGFSHELEFDGDGFCQRGVILVTVNYRLNIFGYFAHPELTLESPQGASGNYGLLDQIQALRWIHENIAAFGGDPDRVTVFGQSGGGRSTQAISCSPLAKGLAHRAIVQSAGGLQTAMGRLPREELERRGVDFMNYTGCQNLAQLRLLPARQLLELFNQYTQPVNGDFRAAMQKGFNISTDGYALPLSMEDSLREGTQGNLDYLLGCTTGDMGSMLQSLAGWAQLQVTQGKKPAYLYQFSRNLPTDNPSNPKELKGAFHSSDLWYTFGTLGRCWRPMTPGDYQLSQTMADAWANFAKTGNPNGEGAPHWDTYNPAAPAMMVFNVAEEGGSHMTSADQEGHLVQDIARMMEE